MLHTKNTGARAPTAACAAIDLEIYRIDKLSAVLAGSGMEAQSIFRQRVRSIEDLSTRISVQGSWRKDQSQ